MWTWFKFKVKISSCSGVCVKEDWQKYTLPSSPLSKVEGLRNIGHSMSIGNLILGVNSLKVSYLIHYDDLLQHATAFLLKNATDITKCDSCFITKCDRSVLQNASGFLLQNAIVLLQNATVITRCEDFITKCDVYYKLRQYSWSLQIMEWTLSLRYNCLFIPQECHLDGACSMKNKVKRYISLKILNFAGIKFREFQKLDQNSQNFVSVNTYTLYYIHIHIIYISLLSKLNTIFLRHLIFLERSQDKTFWAYSFIHLTDLTKLLYINEVFNGKI